MPSGFAASPFPVFDRQKQEFAYFQSLRNTQIVRTKYGIK